MERLDDEHEKLVLHFVNKLLKFVDSELPRSELYSHINLALNVLMGSIVVIANNFIEEDQEDMFIEQMGLSFRANFEERRRGKNDN